MTPITRPHRRIPYHVRAQTKKELSRLLELDIIEPVGDEPTPWVSPIHIVQKPHNPEKIRICIDMRAANKAIKRERHITPTIDDVITELNGAQVFSTLDLNAGYHQVEPAPESRHLMVFSSHTGLFRYKRLNFGVSSAAEKFNDTIRTALTDLKGVLNMSDDILIYGKNAEDHEKNLDACLQCLCEKNLTLNSDKCQFYQRCIKFYGHSFSGSGISPLPERITGIKNLPEPTSSEAVRSLLGLVQYCTHFIPDLATIS